jgi:hypothetical protein
LKAQTIGSECFKLSTANLTDCSSIVFQLLCLQVVFGSLGRAPDSRSTQTKTAFTLALSKLRHYCLLSCFVGRGFFAISKRLEFAVADPNATAFL